MYNGAKTTSVLWSLEQLGSNASDVRSTLQSFLLCSLPSRWSYLPPLRCVSHSLMP